MKIEKIVDLSHPITNDTKVYPGDPEPNITVATTKENEGYNLFNVFLGSQSGSHVDAPYHFDSKGKTIDKMDLSYFMGKALIIDVSYKKSEEEISLDEVKKYEEKIKNSDIVLFRTDWYKKEKTDEFYEHPFLSKEAGEYLLSLDIKTLGIDTINLDNSGGTEFPIHDMYAENEGLIAENLAFFDKVDFEEPFVMFLPLRLIGCDGSPVIAVAVDFK